MFTRLKTSLQLSKNKTKVNISRENMGLGSKGLKEMVF